MLYTRKGDKGDTGLFGCDQRMSKSSVVAEALGTLDEANSFLGICKVKSKDLVITVGNRNFEDIINDIQQNLFIVQAEVAGADKTIKKEIVVIVEDNISKIEKELPPIKTFFVSGGTELSSMFDFSRTLVRRAERRIVAVHEELVRSVAKTATSGSPDPAKRGLGAKSAHGESPDQTAEQFGLGVHTLAFLNRLSSLLYAMARLTNHKSGITEESPRY